MSLEKPKSPKGARNWGVFVCLVLHAVVFGAAAIVLPIRVGLGAWILGLLALGHGAVAALALRSQPRRFDWAFAWLGRVSLLAFCVICAFSLYSASYVAQLYGGLGRGIGAMIGAVLCVVALWTVPVGLWGLSRAPKGVGGSWVVKGSALGLMAAALLGMAKGGASPRPGTLAPPSAKALETELRGYFAAHPPASVRAGYRDPGPWSCNALDDDTGTIVVAYAGQGALKRALCLRIETLDALPQALQEAKLQGLYRLDWITHRDPWRYASEPWLTPLSLRPGIDGVCMQGRCLSAWQLVALDAYLSLSPVSSIPDLRFGVSPKSLWEWLGAKQGAAATRFSGRSYIVGPSGHVTELARQRRTGSAPTREDLEMAKHRAQSYLLSAQRPDGGFEYLRQVFLDQPLPNQLNLPRQGGTLASLCEWGDKSPQVDTAVSKALFALAKHERRQDQASVLWPASWGTRVDLGSTALPLIAFLKCRKRSQGHFDPLIGRLARGLMDFQRKDGGFYAERDLAHTHPLDEQRERLYSAGQAVLALLATLRELKSAPNPDWPSAQRVQAAAAAAMRHYGQVYWSHFLSDFFFIEENWHCLAAKESLGVLEDPTYSQFCLDYLRFKSKFTLGPHSRVDPAFAGGYGFGNLIVPQTTPSAGQAEALTGGIALLESKGQDASALRAELRSILDFLWRQQLDEVNCRGCVLPHTVEGGFTESMISPTVRIDYVQHVMSALGAGLEVLGDSSVSESVS